MENTDCFRRQGQQADARTFAAHAHLRFAEQQISELQPEHLTRAQNVEQHESDNTRSRAVRKLDQKRET